MPNVNQLMIAPQCFKMENSWFLPTFKGMKKKEKKTILDNYSIEII